MATSIARSRHRAMRGGIDVGAFVAFTLHDMDEEQAMRCIETLEDLYAAGRERVLGACFPP